MLLFANLYTHSLIGQKANALPPATVPVSAKPNPWAKDTAISKLFSNPADIKWIKIFKGRMDEAAMVDLVLGSDGVNAKGYLNYPKAKLRLRVEGKFDSTGVKLEERDPSGKLVTAYISGNYKNRRAELDWVSADKRIGSRIDAIELAPGQSIVLNCSDNKWNTRYLTRFNNARCDMVLLRGQNGGLDGSLWIEADAKTYRLKGEIYSDGNFEMEALLSNGKVAALLQGNLKAGQNMDCNWVGSGEKRQFKFTVKDHFQTGCYEYADFGSQYDVLYPRTPCAACNTWLDQQVNAWVAKCKTKLSSNKDPQTPETRNKQRAAAWSEISTWTDQVFSGYLSFTDTWSEQSQGLAYNFDLKTGKVIALADLFNSTFNAKQWLDDYAKKEMPKLAAFSSDPKFREWLNQSGFPMFSIRRDGLELSSLFHPQYGRQTLIVPYEQLKPYMKKDNPAAEFVK